jgi:hypothetical protein
MTTSGLRGFGLAMLLGLAWLAGQAGHRPLAAQQAGGLPALERRVAALEAMVGELQQVNTGQAAEIAALKARVAQVEGQQAALANRVSAVEVKTAPVSVTATTYTIAGRNVFIQDGTGDTESASGLGNLTIGYNVARGAGQDARTGSHNLILGDEHNYTSYGGLVAGDANTIAGPYATVLGGFVNTAGAFGATVGAGSFNTASGVYAAVLGGSFNKALQANSTVSGGTGNEARAENSSVSGGLNRIAPLIQSWAAGGLSQLN